MNPMTDFRHRNRRRSTHSLPTIRRQTVSVQPSSVPTEIIVANYASPEFSFYIALMNTAIMTPIAAEVDMDTPSVSSESVTSPQLVRPSVTSQQQVRTSISSPQQSNRDFTDPPRRRSCSMPNLHVRFCSVVIKHVA